MSLPLFDYAESIRHADAGIALAASHNARRVTEAREIAVEIARREGTVDADRVMMEWCRRGGKIHDFGNSAGAIFKDARFEFTGQYTRSARIHAKGNILRIWRLK